jgi:hypothetical protein
MRREDTVNAMEVTEHVTTYQAINWERVDLKI